MKSVRLSAADAARLAHRIRDRRDAALPAEVKLPKRPSSPRARCVLCGKGDPFLGVWCCVDPPTDMRDCHLACRDKRDDLRRFGQMADVPDDGQPPDLETKVAFDPIEFERDEVKMVVTGKPVSSWEARGGWSGYRPPRVTR